MSNSQYRILLRALTLITFAQLQHHHHCHFDISIIITVIIISIIITVIILVCVRTRAAAVVAGGLISATWCELRRGEETSNWLLTPLSLIIIIFVNHHHLR